MKIWSFICASFLVFGGCASEIPERVPACTGSNVKNCSPVIYFLPDSDVVSPYGKKRLDWIVEKMKRWPNKRAAIIGHAYEWCGEDYNRVLSKGRAKAVATYLVQQGISPDRIRIHYKGNTDPVCDSSVCQDLNKRVVVTVYNPKHWWIF